MSTDLALVVKVRQISEDSMTKVMDTELVDELGLQRHRVNVSQRLLNYSRFCKVKICTVSYQSWNDRMIWCGPLNGFVGTAKCLRLELRPRLCRNSTNSKGLNEQHLHSTCGIVGVSVKCIDSKATIVVFHIPVLSQ
jgi:hypothetical protein